MSAYIFQLVSTNMLDVRNHQRTLSTFSTEAEHIVDGYLFDTNNSTKKERPSKEIFQEKVACFSVLFIQPLTDIFIGSVWLQK